MMKHGEAQCEPLLINNISEQGMIIEAVSRNCLNALDVETELRGRLIVPMDHLYPAAYSFRMQSHRSSCVDQLLKRGI
jgi:hypothetical protein